MTEVKSKREKIIYHIRKAAALSRELNNNDRYKFSEQLNKLAIQIALKRWNL